MKWNVPGGVPVPLLRSLARNRNHQSDDRQRFIANKKFDYSNDMTQDNNVQGENKNR